MPSRPPLFVALLALATVLFTSPHAVAQPWLGEDAEALARSARTRYTIDVSDTRSQLVHVGIALDGIESEATELKMPVWRPGRYEVLDPAGTVRTLTATDQNGQRVPFEKTDKATWLFETKGVTKLTVDYTIYANSIANRTRHADETHAFLSPSCSLMYSPQRRGEALRVDVVNMPDSWRVATGMAPAPGDESGQSFVARDYDTLVDCPLEIGLHDYHSFDVRGVPHEIVIWGRNEADMERLAEDFTKIVEEQARIFELDGPLPYGRYVFLVHCGPGLGGGTEHLNSTIMLTRPSTFTDDNAYEGFLGLVSHEMFHTWNVKRLRPAGITPYEYQDEDYTDLLWVAEGTTSYYDDLVLARTGLIDIDEYISRVRGGTQSIRSRPGLHVQTLEESSFDSWIKFNRSTPDSPNTTVSFYTQGAMASLVLDFWVRDHTADERSLDNVLRDLYQKHPLESGGFTTQDLAASLAEVAERPLDEALKLLEQVVGATGDLPMESVLLKAGLELDTKDPDEGSDLGLRLSDQNGFAVVQTVYEGRPAFGGGVMVDDLIIAIDGARATASAINDILDRTTPGTPVELTIMRRDELTTVGLVTGNLPPAWELKRVKEPTPQQRSRFQSWTGQPFKSD